MAAAMISFVSFGVGRQPFALSTLPQFLLSIQWRQLNLLTHSVLSIVVYPSAQVSDSRCLAAFGSCQVGQSKNQRDRPGLRASIQLLQALRLQPPQCA